MERLLVLLRSDGKAFEVRLNVDFNRVHPFSPANQNEEAISIERFFVIVASKDMIVYSQIFRFFLLHCLTVDINLPVDGLYEALE